MSIKPHRLAALAALAFGMGLAVPAQETGGGIFVLSFQDGIGPGTSGYIVKGLETAIAADAELVILEMDTPGGLDSSMRDIIRAILDSPVPVASFVYPQGARAASAGTYILYASHVAAMAPATNVGSATPVPVMGGGNPLGAPDELTEPDDDGESQPSAESGTAMDRKVINDAVSYIRGLAELRGRNADWAEAAVRDAANLTAQAALAAGVIDLMAEDRADLISQLDGRVVDGSPLSLGGATVTIIEPNWRNKLLSVITNPNVAVMLMMLGIYGLIFEGYNPGAIVPGVVGAISLLLALFALQVLPVNYAGLALMLLGVILMVAEFFVPSFGALGIGGIAAFVFGSLILFDSDVPGFEVAGSLIAGIALTGSILLMATVWLAVRAREQRIVSGVEEMTGLTAEALEDFDGEGQVWVHGERWKARVGTPVTKGQQLTVTRVDGLVLEVRPTVQTTN